MMEVELDLWSSRSDPVDHMLDDVDCCADVDQYLSKHDDEEHDIPCNDDDLNINSLTNINTKSPYDHVIILNDRLMSESLIASRVDHCYILDEDHQHDHHHHNLNHNLNNQHNLTTTHNHQNNQNNNHNQSYASNNNNLNQAATTTTLQSNQTTSLNNNHQESTRLNHSGPNQHLQQQHQQQHQHLHDHQQQIQAIGQLATTISNHLITSSSATDPSSSHLLSSLNGNIINSTNHDHNNLYKNPHQQSPNNNNQLVQNQHQTPNNNNQSQQSVFLSSVTCSNDQTYSQFVSTSSSCSSSSPNQNQGNLSNNLINTNGNNSHHIGFSLNVIGGGSGRLNQSSNHRSLSSASHTQQHNNLNTTNNITNQTAAQHNQTLMNQHLHHQLIFNNQSQLSSISSSSHQISKISSSSSSGPQLLNQIEHIGATYQQQQQQHQFQNTKLATTTTTKRRNNQANSRQRSKVTSQTSSTNNSTTTTTATTTTTTTPAATTTTTTSTIATPAGKGRSRSTKQSKQTNSSIGDATSTSVISRSDAVSSAVATTATNQKHQPLSSLVSPPSPNLLSSGILNSQVSPSSSSSSSSSSGISVSFSSSSSSTSSTSSIADSNERHDEQVRAIEDELTTSASSIPTISNTNTAPNTTTDDGNNDKDTSVALSKSVSSTSSYEASSSSFDKSESEATPIKQNKTTEISSGEQLATLIGGSTQAPTAATSSKINNDITNSSSKNQTATVAPISSANLKKIQSQSSALKNVTLTALLNSTSKHHLDTITSSSVSASSPSSTPSDILSLSILGGSINNINSTDGKNATNIVNLHDAAKTQGDTTNGINITNNLGPTTTATTTVGCGQMSLSALIASSSSLTGSHPHLNQQLNFQSSTHSVNGKPTLQQKKSLASLSSCLIVSNASCGPVAVPATTTTSASTSTTANKQNGQQNLLSTVAAAAAAAATGRVIQSNCFNSDTNLQQGNKVTAFINGVTTTGNIQSQLITSSSSSSSSSSASSSASPSSVSLISNQDWKSAQSGQMVMLTEEEKRTLVAEGYPIPQRFPLTKAEERSLKKIRRKIKNKISAQESRRKKKEYMEELEKRVQTMEQRIMDLERENFNLKQTIISSATAATSSISSNNSSSTTNANQQNANDAFIESILLNHHQQQQQQQDHKDLDHQHRMISTMSLSLNTATKPTITASCGLMAHDDDDDDDDDDDEDSDDELNDGGQTKQEQKQQRDHQGDEESNQSESKAETSVNELQPQSTKEIKDMNQNETNGSMSKSIMAAKSSNITATSFKPEQIESDQNNNDITSSSTDNETDELVGGSSPKRIKLEVSSI